MRAAMVNRRCPAVLNEAPIVNGIEGSTYKRQSVEFCQTVPLHCELNYGCPVPRGGGSIISQPSCLKQIGSGVKAAAEVAEVSATIQIYTVQDRSHMNVKRAMVQDNILVAPGRNSYKRHGLLLNAEMSKTIIPRDIVPSGKGLPAKSSGCTLEKSKTAIPGHGFI